MSWTPPVSVNKLTEIQEPLNDGMTITATVISWEGNN